MIDRTKRNKRIADIIFSVITVVLLVIIAYFVVMQVQGKVPLVMGYGVLHTLTPSMEDTIMTGDYFLIRAVDPEDVREGDIITFYSDDPNIKGYANTHRVHVNEHGVWTEIIDGERVFYTKGDNNYTIDCVPARASQLVGRYVTDLPWLTKSVSVIFGTPLILVFIFVPLLAYVILYYYRLKMLQKREAEEKLHHEAKIEAMVAMEVERLRRLDAEKKQQQDQEKTE